YTFTAPAGSWLFLRVAEPTSTPFAPRADLFTPSNANPQHGDELYHQLTESGTHTVTVRDGTQGGQQTGSYDLHFAIVPGADEAGNLGAQAGRAETLTLGDLDSFTFDGTPGAYVIARVAAADSSGLTPVVRVFDPEGTTNRSHTIVIPGTQA